MLWAANVWVQCARVARRLEMIVGSTGCVCACGAVDQLETFCLPACVTCILCRPGNGSAVSTMSEVVASGFARVSKRSGACSAESSRHGMLTG